MNKVVWNLLEPVDPPSSDTYDERSFLFTQSELFSGGINIENIDFMSASAIEQSNIYAQVTGDANLSPIPAHEAQLPQNAFMKEGINKV